MKKTSKTLAKDIQDLFQSGTLPAGYKVEYFIDFAAEVGRHVAQAVEPSPRPPRDDKTIYASELGTSCYRQLAYKIYAPDKAEPLHYSAKMKFLYGHMLESLMLLLAKLSGHEVSHEQESLEVVTPEGNKIRGRIDALIDGEAVVDVKSTSPIAFDKMTKSAVWSDSFGYVQQLGYYQEVFDPGVPLKNAQFLLVNKVSGEVAQIPNQYTSTSVEGYMGNADHILGHIQVNGIKSIKRKDIVHPKGLVLNTNCSYCAFKFDCWKDSNGGSGLRVFKYAKGPLFFTEVKSKDGAFLNKEVIIKNAGEKAVIEETEGDGGAGDTADESGTTDE